MGAKGHGRTKVAAQPNLYDEVTERIVAELEAGRAPWAQPWGTPGAKAGLGLPRAQSISSGSYLLRRRRRSCRAVA
ncbi:MAG: DUF1738 domain-containing protein [Rhodospirillales bacterium]|nr:DUF1738 domain-containing protein [Rhodospirillales bacterium]